jgi:hypothetical protein
MIIVDSFCFFEPYQMDMLLIKLNVECPWVDEWVITENTYSFRGDYKGTPHVLKGILETDKRFEKFLPKIKVIEVEIERKCKPGVEDWEIIFLQREAQKEYIYSKYPPETWLLISDIDEIIDFENSDKALLMLKTLQENEGKQVRPNPIFFAFDFDNTFIPAGDWYGMVFAQLSYLQKRNIRLEQPRVEHLEGLLMPRGKVGYHYHSCMSPQYIYHKLCTYGHTGFCKSDVNQWLYYNHGMFKSLEGESVDPKRFTLETIDLTEESSPLYVRKNLTQLKTHSVHTNYRHNRIDWLNGNRDYPDIVGTEYPEICVLSGVENG